MGLYLGKLRIIAINEKVATKQWVTDLGYLTNTNLSDYVTNDELQPVSDKIDDVSSKVEDISTKIIKKGTLGTINGKSIENGNNITIDLSLDGYYTKEQTDEKFLTKAEVGNLADYVKNGELDTKVGEAGYVKTDALTSYAKKTEIPTVPTKLSELINDSGYITTYTETDPVWTSEKSNYYTKTEIDNKNYLTEHQSLADYIKNSELDTKVSEAGYVKTEALTAYAKKTDIPSVPTKLSELTNDSGYITTYTETDPVWTSEKSNYYTKTEIDNKNYLTEHQSLADYVKNGELDTKVGEAGYVKTEALTTTLTSYAKKTDIPTVPTKLSELTNDSGYITTYTETDPVWNSEKVNYYTKTEIDNKNYLTEHQSLADYAKKSEIPTDYVRPTELTDYATKTYVTEQIGSINSVLETI